MKMKYFWVLALMIIGALPVMKAQNVQSDFDWQARFDRLYDEAAMRYHFESVQPKDVVAWQKALLGELKQSLGVTQIEKSLADFKPYGKFLHREELDDFIRERWIIWTEPDVPLPCVILRPKNIKGKTPLVITPHGHNANTELYAGVCLNANDSALIRDGERDIAVQAVKEGYITISPTTRGFGNTRHPREISSKEGHSCRTLLVNDLLVGRTPIGDRVWDMMKLIDYALENLPVDGKNIIMTGTSGGGTTTLFASAVDPRITISAPSAYFCTFKGSIGTIIHCECNYIPGILNLGEMSDIAGLIAPRPFHAITGIKDDIFPIEETRKAFGELKQIYKAFGAEKDCQLFEGQGGHRYYKAGVWKFVKAHLK